MPSRALVTGGGRGIGAGIARELAAAGWHVTVTARTSGEVEDVARAIDGDAVVGDVSVRADVERMVRPPSRSTCSSRMRESRSGRTRGRRIRTSGGTCTR
jgi:NAD(P)-dependent dehydrogenase (short-subunit alcohol dehydrogenase family)